MEASSSLEGPFLLGETVPQHEISDEKEYWFDKTGGMRAINSGNRVTGFISGVEAFASMAAAIESAQGPADYIYMLNWSVDLDVKLKPSISLEDALFAAERRLVQIRAMFWDQPFFQNSKAVDRLNDASVFPGAAAILDNNTINNFPAIPAGLIALLTGPIAPTLALQYFVARYRVGSHHQKILVVKGRDGLIAFVGGVDFNEDRIRPVWRQKGSPMHDVHCKIEGPAARDVLQIFLDRWQDHEQSQKLKRKGVADLRGVDEPIPETKGSMHVQIGCTYGDGKHHSGIRNVKGGTHYSFAPDGDRSAERLIRHAILRSERIIYIEDQYLVGKSAAIALCTVLGRPARFAPQVVILIPHSCISDHPLIWKLRKEFVDTLFRGLDAAQKERVTICYRKRAGVAPNIKKIDDNIPESYVHAKMMIVDDKFAMIGSANSGTRSYTHDSEVVAGIFDGATPDSRALPFAHGLRVRLWTKHLLLPPHTLHDPVAALAHWRKPSPASAIGIYDPAGDIDVSIRNFAPDHLGEPYGGIPGKELAP